MIKLVVLFAALFAVSAHAQEQWEHPDSRLGVIVFNDYGRRFTTDPPGSKVIMKLYSQNRRGKEWGPYEIASHVKGFGPEIIIDCKEDEKICLGASAGNMQTGFDPERDATTAACAAMGAGMCGTSLGTAIPTYPATGRTICRAESLGRRAAVNAGRNFPTSLKRKFPELASARA